MRMFLPIKGPGGRLLTPGEKVALLVLGLTLVASVLTLLSGEHAFVGGPAHNPVFGLFSAPSRVFGGGIVALYGLVLVWSSLIYFKGERVARVTPLAGRIFAALGVAIGISGAMGVAQLGTAGSLGAMIGTAIHNTLGGPVGLPILLLLVLVGFNLAAQGSIAALREPAPAAAGGAAAAPKPFSSFAHAAVGFAAPPVLRRSPEPVVPDDGDPTAEARTLAVTQGLEEIEREKGVTILEVERGEPARPPSIGEEVELAPPPPPHSEEAEIQRSIEQIAQVLEAVEPPPAPPARPAAIEVAPYEPPYVPEAANEPAVVEACSEPGEGVVTLDPAPVIEADPAAIPEASPEPSAAEAVPEAPAPVVAEAMEPAVAPPEPPQVGEQLLLVSEATPADPYEKPGLLDRVPTEERALEEPHRRYASFDWRGRPIE